MKNASIKLFKLILVLTSFLFITHVPADEEKELITILSIDGGGVRGIIPARILQSIEEKTGCPTAKLFDIISGNSTGGLVAAGLAASNDLQNPIYSAKDLVNFYKTQSANIFRKSALHTIFTGYGLWGAKYDRTNLDQTLSNLFGEAVLSKTLSNLVMVSYSLDRKLPHLWSGRLARKHPLKDFYVRDATGATAAAPTYFAPKEIFDTKGKKIYCEVDGGLYANNPASIASIEAVKAFPHFNRKKVVFVSLGTGEVSAEDSNNQEKGGIGIIGWLKDKHVIDIMIDANSELVDYEISELFPAYYRIQITIPKQLLAMDDGSLEHIEKLLAFTDNYLLVNDKTITELAMILSKNLPENLRLLYKPNKLMEAKVKTIDKT